MRSKETRVGARGLLKIEADPQATPEEIRRLPKKKALAHVNCPPELWWELAALHPMEAQASTLYELITLMEPGKWDELEKANAEKWIDRFMGHLPVPSQHLFSADCAEHVLPFFENVFPDDDRPREAIRMRRVLAQGLTNTAEGSWVAASKAAAKAGRHAARMAEDSAPASQAVREARWTARGAANAAAGPAVGSSLAYAPAAAALVFGKGGSAIPERMWQWRRLQAYLRGNAGQVGAYPASTLTQEEIEKALREHGGSQVKAALHLRIWPSLLSRLIHKFHIVVEKPIKPSSIPPKAEIEKALLEANGHQKNAAKGFGVPSSTFGSWVRQYGIVTKKSPEMQMEIRQKQAESHRAHWFNMSQKDRDIRSEEMSKGWERMPEGPRHDISQRQSDINRAKWDKMSTAERDALAEQQRQRWQNMPKEERDTYSDATRKQWDKLSDTERRARKEEATRRFQQWRDNLSADDRAAWVEAIRQGWADKDLVEKKAWSALQKARFAALSSEQKQVVMAAIKAKRKEKNNTVGAASRRSRKERVGAVAKLPSDLIIQYWSYLDDQGRRLYLALCLETVLPIFEKQFPNDDRPRRAMEAAKAYAYGKISKRAMYNKARVANVDYAGTSGSVMTTQRALYAGEASNYLGREWLPREAAGLSWNAVPDNQKRALQEKQLEIMREVLRVRAADANLHAKNEEYFPLPPLQSKDPFLVILATNLRQAVVQMIETLQAEMRTPKFPKKHLDALYEIIGQINNEIQETTNAKDWVYAADNYDLLFQESEPPTALELAIYVTLGKDPSKVAKTLLRLSQERNRAL